MNTEVLITCSNTIDAHVIKSKLLSEGIQCFLNNEHFTSLMPQYFGILGSGVQVVVNKHDLEKAREIISLNNQEITCPNCRSNKLNLFPAKLFYKFWMLLLALFLIIPIGNLVDQYQCRSCKTVFRHR